MQKTWIIIQNLFFGRCGERKEVNTQYNKWDNEYPKQKTRNLFGKI